MNQFSNLRFNRILLTLVWPGILIALLFTGSSANAQFLKFKQRNVAFQSGVEYVQAMYFSQDEKYAYTASAGGLGVFDYNAGTGSMALKEVHYMTDYGYENNAVNNIVFSNEGTFAYTTTSSTKNIHYWKRDVATGKMTFLGQVQGSVDQFGYTSSLCMSPDNNFLYVGAGTVVNIYSRNLSDGSLTLVKRESSGTSQNDIYISKDGKFLYLSGSYLRVFTRNITTGLFTFLDEYVDWSSPTGITSRFAVTPDDKYIYAATQKKGIARYRRDASTGKLTAMDFFNYPRADVFNPLGPTSIRGMQINSAGDRLYVGSYMNLSSWSIDGAGNLALLDNVDEDQNPSGNEPFFGVGVSRDGQYVFGFGSDQRETSVECFRADTDNTLDSVRLHYFGQTLNKGLYAITAEVLSADNQYIYTASFHDQCFTAFQSGVSAGGEMKEVNRIYYRDVPSDPELFIDEMITTPDHKHLYAAGDSSIFRFDINGDGSIVYRETIDLPAAIVDVKLTHNGKYLYVSLSNKSLSTYQRQATGVLSLTGMFTPSDRNNYFGPEQITISPDDQWLYLTSMDHAPAPLELFTFSINSLTGALQLANTREMFYSNDKNAFRLLLSEIHQKAFLVHEFGYFYAIAYPWNSTTGVLGDASPHVGDYVMPDAPVQFSRGEDYLMVNGDDETRFFGFQEDGTLVLAGTQHLNRSGSWSSAGGEAAIERYLIPSVGNLYYGIRPAGNGVYVYEAETTLPPLPPHKVNAVGGERQITITWNKNKETNVVYHIYRKLTWNGEDPGNLTKVGETTNLSFIDTSMDVNAPYYYFVQAIVTGKSSAMSSHSPSATAVDLAPASPQNVVAQSGDKFIKLTWSPNTEIDLKNYTLYRHSQNNLAGASLLATTTNTSFTDQSVAYDQTYYYWIKALDNSSESLASSVVFGAAVNLPPTIPSGVALQSGDKFIKLTWLPNTETDLKNYAIYRHIQNDLAGASLLNTTTNTSFTDQSVSYDQTYYYWIKASDNSSESLASSVVNGTAVNLPPAIPSGLALQTGDKFISLSWNQNTETDFSTYEIYRGVTSAVQNAELLKSTTEHQLVDNTVEYLHTYFYFVRAIDAGNHASNFTPNASGMPVDNPPAQPKGLSATFNDSQDILLRWTANTETDLMGYRIFRGTTNLPSNAEQLSEQGKAAGNQFVDINPPNGVVYYWIKAFDKNNNSSAFSDLAQIIVTGNEVSGASSVTFYPNPVHDYLVIHNAEAHSTFVLLDVQGRPVRSGELSQDHVIDCSDLPAGSYICQIKSRKETQVFNIIKL